MRTLNGKANGKQEEQWLAGNRYPAIAVATCPGGQAGVCAEPAPENMEVTNTQLPPPCGTILGAGANAGRAIPSLSGNSSRTGKEEGSGGKKTEHA